MEPIIQVEGLRKSYRGRLVVDSLSFHVREGEVFGFLGPNGAGKSTTMRMLLGLTRPDAGSIRVAGFPVPSRAKEVHRISGVAFEISNLYERLTARENLRFFARLVGATDADVQWWLEATGLAGRAGDSVHTFSRGMRQRLILARAMLQRPRLLFLDEPTAGLDPNAARDVRELIRSFRDRDGVTVFLTTHDMAEAETLCDRVGIIHQGRLLALDTVENLQSRYGEPRIRLKPLAPAGPGAPQEELYPMDGTGWMERVRELQRRGIPFQIRSQEASLAQVFHRLTGAGPGTPPRPAAQGGKRPPVP